MPPSSRPPAITADLLLRAYAAGLFPMAEGADDPELFWVDPEHRGIFPLDGMVVSRSLRRVVRSDRFAIRFDRDFDGVVAACAEAASDRPTTWINATIRRLYGELFTRGAAHSVEAYLGDELVGGLYGVSLGGAFFGESMFHRATDASKVCLVHLAAHLVRCGFVLLDAQFVTPHLATLGAVEIPRAAYHAQLAAALRIQTRFREIERHEKSGESALASLHALRSGEPPVGYLPAGSLPPNSVG